MTKYIGQANFATGLNVTVDLPLDDRTIVNSFEDLYNIHNSYAGMTVAVLDTGVVYTLIDVSKKGTVDGWKASGLAIEVLKNEEEYNKLIADGELKEDVFYFIKEVENEKQGYVTYTVLEESLTNKVGTDIFNTLVSRIDALEARIAALEPSEEEVV